ncbi:MAG TPA: iron uptake porin, partial [Allocoleopsis sp.]
LDETEKEQFNQVDQLQDIQSGDWAADALQNLIDHYQCLPGNIKTFAGNKTINREEFASILNLCLKELEKLITKSNPNFINKEDLTKLQQLRTQFEPELVKLNQQLEKLENRTEILSSNKFSATGKFTGDIAIGMVGLFGDQKAGGDDLQDNGIIIHRSRLKFNLSFTGKDLLKITLQGRNSTSLNTNITGTNMSRISIDVSENNAIRLNDTFYRFPLSDRTNIWIIGGIFGAENIVNLMNPPITSDSNHGISAFGLFNPVYRMTSGPGIAIKHKFDNQLSFTFNYRATNSNITTPQFGLFNGNYALVTELAYTPSKNFGIGFTYINNYFRGNNIDLFGGIGSEFARKPFGN